MSDSTPPPSSSHHPPPARRTYPVRDDAEHDKDGAPTPARALLGQTEEESSGSPKLEEAVVEVGDDRWTVRVSGRGRTGAATGGAPVLLLTFRKGDAEAPEREKLVVGRALSELSEEQLRRALERGRPPVDPGSRKEIFTEVGGRDREG